MHQIFKKQKVDKIQLDENWWLYPDSFKGLVLQREVAKVRKKKDETEEIVKETKSFYYPTISMTLTKYLNEKTLEATTIEELRDKVLEVEKVIKSIKEKW